MEELLAAINHWIHLLLVILWVGGLAFQTFILSPAAESFRLPPEFIEAYTSRFRAFLAPIVFIVIVSGMLNLGSRGRLERAINPQSVFDPGYVRIIMIKLALVVALISIYLWEAIILKRRRSGGDGKPTLDSAVKLTGAATVIGIFIILLASMLRWHRFAP